MKERKIITIRSVMSAGEDAKHPCVPAGYSVIATHITPETLKGTQINVLTVVCIEDVQ